MATIYHLGGFGSGKSYDALFDGIYHELISGTRGIVTNLSLLQIAKCKGEKTSTKPGLGALNDLIQRRFKNLDARVLQRVRILTEDEVPHFYCHRISRGGFHYDIPVPSVDEEKRGKRPDFSLLRDDGIVFVIDEFHDFFNARAWAEVGRSAGWYKNQQRKLGDDIHACTPQIDEVDKQFRTIGHEYKVYTNLGLRKIRGVVMPQTFICSVYSSLDSIKRHGQPISKYPFTLDIELANCYDTAKGVRGIQGGSADIGKRPKGIHWSIPVILFVALIIGIIWLGFAASRKFKRMNASKPSPAVVATNKSAVLIPSIQTDAPQPKPSAGLPVVQLDTNAVVCVGWCRLGPSNYMAFLSDGTQYESQYHELGWIQRRKISILGKVYDIHDRDPSPLPAYQYVPPVYVPPPAVDSAPPVNEVQSTVIGQAWMNRQAAIANSGQNGFHHQPQISSFPSTQP